MSGLKAAGAETSHTSQFSHQPSPRTHINPTLPTMSQPSFRKFLLRRSTCWRRPTTPTSPPLLPATLSFGSMSVWRSSLARASSSSASGLRLAPASSSSSRTFASSLACSLPRASSFSSPPTPQRQPAPTSSSSQPAQPSYFDYVVPQGRSRKAPSSQEHVVASRAGKGTKADETALLAGDVKVDVPGSESQSRTEVEVESSRGDRAKFQKWNRNHLFVRLPPTPLPTPLSNHYPGTAAEPLSLVSACFFQGSTSASRCRQRLSQASL